MFSIIKTYFIKLNKFSGIYLLLKCIYIYIYIYIYTYMYIELITYILCIILYSYIHI